MNHVTATATLSLCHDDLKRVFAAAAVCFNRLYIHGGCLEGAGKLPEPRCDMLLFDHATNSVGQVPIASISPMLCKHQMRSISHKLIAVGGWDGLKRRNAVWVFDTRYSQWCVLRESIGSDPEQSPAGLSSHTFTQIDPSTFVITGREGSVRYQKRFASVFQLQLDLTSETCQYKRMSHQIDSRSGHSASLVPNFARSTKAGPAVIIVGGRKAENIDALSIKGFDVVDVAFDEHDQTTGSLVDKLETGRLKNRLKQVPFRLHAAVALGSWVILHGGRVFNKMRGDVIGSELVVYNSSTSRWYTVPIESNEKLDLLRYGHQLATIDNELFIVTGGWNDYDMSKQIVKLTLA